MVLIMSKCEVFTRMLRSLAAFVIWVVYVLWISIRDIILCCWPDCLCPKSNVRGVIVLITGAANGLGRQIALQLADKGAILVLWDIDSEQLTETVKMINNMGAEAYAYIIDVGDRESVYNTAEKVQRQVGDVQILVNNAGIVAGRSLLYLSDNMIENTINVNLLAHFWTTRAFLPQMMRNNCGHIVCVASVAGVVGTADLTDYCAAKFGLIGFMESLAVELQNAHSKVKHLTVCPYFIKTNMFHGVNTRFQLLLPMLEPEDTAMNIINAIQTGKEIIYLPGAATFMLSLKGILPVKAIRALGHMFGAHTAMRSFRGSVSSLRSVGRTPFMPRERMPQVKTVSADCQSFLDHMEDTNQYRSDAPDDVIVAISGQNRVNRVLTSELVGPIEEERSQLPAENSHTALHTPFVPDSLYRRLSDNVPRDANIQAFPEIPLKRWTKPAYLRATSMLTEVPSATSKQLPPRALKWRMKSKTVDSLILHPCARNIASGVYNDPKLLDDIAFMDDDSDETEMA